MKARFEKVAPMQWRIYVPGHAPFHCWVYALVDPDGREH